MPPLSPHVLWNIFERHLLLLQARVELGPKRDLLLQGCCDGCWLTTEVRRRSLRT